VIKMSKNIIMKDRLSYLYRENEPLCVIRTSLRQKCEGFGDMMTGQKI